MSIAILTDSHFACIYRCWVGFGVGNGEEGRWALLLYNCL